MFCKFDQLYIYIYIIVFKLQKLYIVIDVLIINLIVLFLFRQCV
jgi:hypothetical protein